MASMMMTNGSRDDVDLLSTTTTPSANGRLELLSSATRPRPLQAVDLITGTAEAS